MRIGPSAQFVSQFAVAATLVVVGANAARSADMAMKAPPVVTSPAPFVQYWAGLDARDNSIYGYAGSVFALNGNLNQNGWIFRISGGDGRYKYNRAVGLNQ